MKRICSFFLICALLMCLSPHGLAEETLSRLGPGMLVTADARNGLTYRADFFLSSVEALRRSGDDLIIEMDGGSITLSAFFGEERDARQLIFSDGSFISGNDFDADGVFTGELFRGVDLAKENDAVRRQYADDPEAFLNCCVRQLPYGFEVLREGAAVYGEEKQLLLDIYASLFGEKGLDMSTNSSNALYLRSNDDGTYTPVRQTLFTNDGFVITCERSECLAIESSGLIAPLSEGRASVSFSNKLGEPVGSFSAKVFDDNGTLSLSLPCPQCGAETGGVLHLAACGHFTCQSDYDTETHGTGDCQLAGHCISDGREHGVCKNCRGFLCDGHEHGSGVCQHVHQWFTTSHTPGDADNPPHSTNICLICGQTMYQ
ncbi:MAG: hypothetical protein Q4E35_07125 [Eubacteriales bacterium]|nr:hypothetical protein [Eubacteriales bacterium]